MCQISPEALAPKFPTARILAFETASDRKNFETHLLVIKFPNKSTLITAAGYFRSSAKILSVRFDRLAYFSLIFKLLPPISNELEFHFSRIIGSRMSQAFLSSIFFADI